MMADVAIFTWAFWLLLCIANVGMVGFFTGLEIGVYRLNTVRMELLAETGDAAAVTMRTLSRSPNRLLAVLLIGTNIHHYVATFAVSTMFVMAGCLDHVEWYTLAATTPLLFVLGDSVPKNVQQRLGDARVYRRAWVLRWADRIFLLTGLTLLVRFFSEGLLWLLHRGREDASPHLGHEGLKAIVAEGQAVGALSSDQADMAGRVMMLSDVHLREAMQPLASAETIQPGMSRTELLEFIREKGHTRLPICDPAGQVLHILNVYDVLADESGQSPDSLALPPVVLQADLQVSDALLAMQRVRRSLAVVANPAGRHVGIVTIKDLVEEIVGELEEW